MVIDSSALVAILSNEEDAPFFAESIAADTRRLISAASLLETAIVIETRYGLPGGEKLDLLLERAQVQVEAVTQEQASVARLAYRTYGKGRHPAGLNYGDCFAYALAQVTGEPLLFKGDDFTKTDVAVVGVHQ